MVSEVLFSSNSDNWSTPKNIYDYYMSLGCLDPCPLNCVSNNLCVDFGNNDLFINPPYSDIKSWVSFSLNHIYNHRSNCVYLLVPSRTDTKWFHNILECEYIDYSLYFYKGRLKFSNSCNVAPFPSVLITIKYKNI